MSEMTIEQIHQMADRMGWEVETGTHGQIILITGTIDPNFDAVDARQMRDWVERDRRERSNMS